MNSIDRLPGFGWEFSGLIEFTKRSGRTNSQLISREKAVILARLNKAGNVAKWGDGRKWTVSEIPNLEKPMQVTDSVESWQDPSPSSETYELDRLRLASRPIPRKILNELRSGERSVGKLCHDMKQHSVSNHLTLLRVTGLVERSRDGQCAYYSLTPKGRNVIENVVKAVS